MCTVRYVGLFLQDPLAVPWPVIEHLGQELGIEDVSCIKQYTERLKTAYEHAWEIRDATATTSTKTLSGAGCSVRSCTAGRGRTPRGRWRCSTSRGTGCAGTGCCCPK
ncbi:hypothetical protein GCM10022384_48540 [Streptomyces marokkonensis]|uniref:DUF4158 domain-containing protein n=1 Tax=Streptomyces marokkonensis TaxID=324855 RepID=A0ABP7RBW6_9ACTN